MTVYRTITQSLQFVVPLILVTRTMFDELSLVQAKELTEWVVKACGVSYYIGQPIKMHDYIMFVKFAYMLRYRNDANWATKKMKTLVAQSQRLTVYKLLFCEWINAIEIE